MNGLYHHKQTGHLTTLSLLRFYENGYVIYAQLTGDKKEYFAKELRRFTMDGHKLVGHPELTFWGSYRNTGDTLDFKVENEVTSLASSRGAHDIYNFFGTIHENGGLHLRQTSKKTKAETDHIFLPIADQKLLNTL